MKKLIPPSRARAHVCVGGWVWVFVCAFIEYMLVSHSHTI